MLSRNGEWMKKVTSLGSAMGKRIMRWLFVHRGTRQENKHQMRLWQHSKPKRHNWTAGCGQLFPLSTLRWSWEAVPYWEIKFYVTGKRWQFGSRQFEPYGQQAPEVNRVASLLPGLLTEWNTLFLLKKKKKVSSSLHKTRGKKRF